VFEVLARSRTARHRQVQRTKALLLAAEGMANTRIGQQVGVSAATVQAWRARCVEDGVARLGKVRSGRGRKPAIPPAKIDQILDLTRNSTPDGETHWSCRSMAKKARVSKDTVQRVWAARSLRPHLVTTFKLSNDPKFEEKLIDLVGLYLDPPDNAMVLCMDEKSSVQALDRTQPSLPMVTGRAQTMTHDYKCHGATTLFAALDVLTGKVIGSCLPKHRHQEVLKFLRTIDGEVPKGLGIHMILDNYASTRPRRTRNLS
jgi:transposase